VEAEEPESPPPPEPLPAESLPPEPLPVLLETLPLPALATPLAEPLDAPDPGAEPVDEVPPPDDAKAPADAERPASPAEPFPLLIVEPPADPALAGPVVPLAAPPLPELPPEPRPDVTALFSSAAEGPVEELPQPEKKAAERKYATLDHDLFVLIFTLLARRPIELSLQMVLVNERLARVKSREFGSTAQIGGKKVPQDPAVPENAIAFCATGVRSNAWRQSPWAR
jgi:hypothetical protein